MPDNIVDRLIFLCDDDFAKLLSFSEQVNDPDSGGYSTTKATLNRLAELGVVQSMGFGRYGVTSFGQWLIDSHLGETPSLPLSTASEYNSLIPK